MKRVWRSFTKKRYHYISENGDYLGFLLPQNLLFLTLQLLPVQLNLVVCSYLNRNLRGRIGVLVLQNQFWVMVLESKKTTLSVWSALPP
jgi:hypothetical protein